MDYQAPGLLLRCVNCGCSLGVWSSSRTEYVCEGCHEVYPVIDGVLDFIGGQDVLGRAQLSSFAIHQSDDVGRQVIDTKLAALLAEMPPPESGARPPVLLDVGSGYGDLTAAAAALFELVVSVNASMAELQSASALLESERTHNVVLIRALAQDLPFMPFQFPAVACVQVLEHVDSPPQVLAQLGLMLTQDGVLYLAFPNRFTLRRESHTKLHGIGFLPGAWARRYAAWTGRGSEYQSVHMLSAQDMARWLRAQFGNRYRFIRSHSHLSLSSRIADHLWEYPPLRGLVLLLTADTEVLCWSSPAGRGR